MKRCSYSQKRAAPEVNGGCGGPSRLSLAASPAWGDMEFDNTVFLPVYDSFSTDQRVSPPSPYYLTIFPLSSPLWPSDSLFVRLETLPFASALEDSQTL